MKTLIGTEKQISYANDLLKEMNDRIQRMVAKGRTERVQDNINFINAITDNSNAGNVIEICNNFDFFVHGVNNYGKTWSECIEKGKKI